MNRDRGRLKAPLLLPHRTYASVFGGLVNYGVCRPRGKEAGGSKSLTFTAVVHRRSSRRRANRHTVGNSWRTNKQGPVTRAESPAGAADR